MVDTYTQQKVQTVGNVSKTYAINSAGVLGNVSGSKFYPLSTYELSHDVSNVKRDASGRVTFYTLSGADAAQYAAAEAARVKAAAAKALAAQKAADDAAKAAAAAKTKAAAEAAAKEKQIADAKAANAKAAAAAAAKKVAAAEAAAKAATATATTKAQQAAAAKAKAAVDAAAAASKAAATKLASSGGYVVTMSTAQQNAFVRNNSSLKAQGKPQITEDAYRKSLGLSTQRSASIRYVAPKLTTSNPSAATTGNKSTGVSNALTGSQKIAAQSKTTSTPLVVAKKIPSTNTIKTASGNYISQIQKQGNNTESVKILGADSRITTEQRNVLYQQKLAGNYNPTGLKINYVKDGKNTIATHGTVTSQLKADQVAEAKAAAAAEAARVKALQAAFIGNVKFGKSGEVIDAIWSKGSDSTGERGVTLVTRDKSGTITGLSKSQSQFKTEAKNREIANIPIKIGMNSADIAAIQKARQEQQARTPLKLTYPEDDDMAKHQAIVDYRKQGKIQNILGAVYDATDDTKSLKASAIAGYDSAAVKLDQGNKWAAKKISFLPTGDQIENTLTKYNAGKAIDATPFAGLALTGKAYNAIEKKIEESPKLKNSRIVKLVDKSIQAQQYVGDALIEGTGNFVKDEYDTIRTKPLSKGLEYGAYYVSGGAFGVAVKGAKIRSALKLTKAAEKSAGFLTKTAEKTASPWMKKSIQTLEKRTTGILTTAAANSGRAIDIGMTGMLVGDYGKEASKGYTKNGAAGVVESSLKFGEALAIGGVGFNRGVRAVKNKDPFLLIPTVETVTLQAIPQGASAKVSDIAVGKTLAVFNRPIVSYSAKGGIKLGSPEIDPALIRGERIHPYTKLDTRILDTHIEKNFGEADKKYWFDGRTIATKGYNAPRPIQEPTTFQVLSKNIPDTMKPVARDTIIAYGAKKGNEIQVYGSNSLKMQMGKYLSGTPKDIEVSVDSVAKFSNAFKAKATKAGFVEGKDFRITVNGKPVTTVADGTKPKIEFSTGAKNKNGGLIWDKGVEVFSHEVDPVTGVIVKSKYRTEENLPFGFKMKSGIKSEGVDIMPMQEQAVRNYRGGTTLKDGVIEPEHQGRIKDIRRLIETGVGNENTFNTGIKPTIVEYSKTMVDRFPEVKESPIAEYIAAQGKVPNRAQSFTLNSNVMTKPERNLIVRGIDRKMSGDIGIWGKSKKNLIEPTTSRSVDITTQNNDRGIFGRTKKGMSDMMADESAIFGLPDGKIAKNGDLTIRGTGKKVSKKITSRSGNQPKPRLSRRSITESSEPVERELLFESRGKSKLEVIDGKLTNVSKALGSKPLGIRSTDLSSPLGSIPLGAKSIHDIRLAIDTNGGLGSKSSGNIFGRNRESKALAANRDTGGKPIGITSNSKGVTHDRRSIETNPPITYPGKRKPISEDTIKSKPIGGNPIDDNSKPPTPIDDNSKPPTPIDDNSKPPTPIDDNSKPPAPIDDNSKPPAPIDPYNPYPVKSGEGGGSGGYSGFIDYHKHDPIDDGWTAKKKKKLTAIVKLPWAVSGEALMISRTKVNTFSEMLGHTGKKAAYGSEKKVTKTNIPSPFNKKVTMSTMKSLTPVAMDMAQKGLERKITVIAKTPMKYSGAVPAEIRAKISVPPKPAAKQRPIVVPQKTAATTRKPTLSKPRSQSNSAMPIQKVTQKTVRNPTNPFGNVKQTFKPAKSAKKSSPW